MFDKLLHKYLKLPYTLHTSVKRRVNKPQATILFLHGIGHSGEAWQNVIAALPDKLNVISVDLLGFGSSPKPAWAKYSAKTQARAIGATLLKMSIRRPLIVVGHSMGALIAVELGRRHPSLIGGLILCSPPFYHETASRKIIQNRGERLKKLYRLMKDHPERISEIARLATRYKLVNVPLSFKNGDVKPFMAALEATIINQTSLEDAKSLRVPTRIIHGALDPFVIRKNLIYLEKHNSHVDLKVILAGHEVQSKTYVSSVVEAIQAAVNKKARLS